MELNGLKCEFLPTTEDFLSYNEKIHVSSGNKAEEEENTCDSTISEILLVVRWSSCCLPVHIHIGISTYILLQKYTEYTSLVN